MVAIMLVITGENLLQYLICRAKAKVLIYDFYKDYSTIHLKLMESDKAGKGNPVLAGTLGHVDFHWSKRSRDCSG